MEGIPKFGFELDASATTVDPNIAEDEPGVSVKPMHVAIYWGIHLIRLDPDQLGALPADPIKARTNLAGG